MFINHLTKSIRPLWLHTPLLVTKFASSGCLR